MDHRNSAHISIKAKFPFLSSSKYDSSFLNLQQHSDKCRALVECYRVKGLKKTAYQLESLNLYHLRIRYKCCSSIYIGKAPVCLRLGRAEYSNRIEIKSFLFAEYSRRTRWYVLRRAAKFRNFSPGFEISTCKTVRHFYAYAKLFLLFIELEIGWH